MPNSSGKNQYQNGNITNEDILHAALFQYAKERLPLQQQLTRLKKELNYDIKLTKLKQLNKAFNFPTVRKPPPAEVSTQLVLLALAEDVGGCKGIGGIRDKLKDRRWMIPRGRTKLDEFVIYWNNHTIHSQPEKLMPPGTTPRHIYTCPEEWGAESLAIPLQTNEQDEADVEHEIQELCNSLDMPRSEAFHWVDEDYDPTAQLLYQQLGSPPITALSAWDLFMAMLPALQDMYGEE
ncbi:hypothetical protein JB92DRAFT_3110839 [Gautieria morchelliformis]|nr:hypothetical protein JB92DRAFT_3110839 [Gautieria morchelliformis]